MGRDPERDSATTEHDELSKPPSERRSGPAPQPNGLPVIPRAPALPSFALPPGAEPGYAPEESGRKPPAALASERASHDQRDTIRHVSSEPFELSEAPTRGRRDGRTTQRSPPPGLPRVDNEVWEPAEIELLEGKRGLVIERFERAANRSVQGVAGDGAIDDLGMLATLAAGFFTTAPVFRHFAPFDLSLFSIARVQAGLDVVYGAEPRPDAASDVSPALLLLGAYLGECLRQAYGGEWRGPSALSDETSVDALGNCWQPFRELRARLERGTELRFTDPGTLHPGAEPFAQRLSIPLSPPALWDPEPWPRAELLPRFGLALSRSVVSEYCAHAGGGPLDGSIASLESLELYVALLAPARAPRAADAPWLRRASVLVGAYLGEALCDGCGARWQSLSRSPRAPEDYALVLGGRRIATPVAAVHERLRGKRLELLADHAREVVKSTRR